MVFPSISRNESESFDLLISDMLLIGDRGTNLLDGGAPFYET